MIWTKVGNHGGGGGSGGGSVGGASPFDKYAEKKSVILYLEPVLNTYYQQYVNILTLSGLPSGPLRELVYTIQTPRLSPFQQCDWMSCDSCIFVLGRYPGMKSTMNHMNTFMMADDIPSVISYLREHGYVVDTNITEMLQKSGVIGGSSPCRGNRKMICMFS